MLCIIFPRIVDHLHTNTHTVVAARGTLSMINSEDTIDSRKKKKTESFLERTLHRLQNERDTQKYREKKREWKWEREKENENEAQWNIESQTHQTHYPTK